jgi:tetrahydromethanopterin S-methyltransferase subunit G
MATSPTTELEKDNLEAHVDLCALRYEHLDNRLGSLERKVDNIHTDIQQGNASMIKVLIGTAGTIIAGLLSTVVVILMQ